MIRSLWTLTVWRKFGRSFLAVFGSLWLLLEPATLSKPDQFNFGWAGYLILVLASIVIALIYAWPRKQVEFVMPESELKISLRVGDVLKQKGNILIGTNDVFDTELGDIIRPDSLQGQFLAEIYGNDQNALDNAIATSLQGVEGVVDDTKQRGKNIRYPVGQVATLKYSGNHYYLAAYSRMAPNLRASSDGYMIWSALIQCWGAVRESGQYEPLHVPVVGSNLARTSLTRHLLIQMIVLSFLLASKEGAISPSLTIYIYPSDIKTIDFAGLAHWLKLLVAKTS